MIKVDQASETGSKHSDDATNYYIISDDKITRSPEKYHDNVDKEDHQNNQNGGQERLNTLDDEVHKLEVKNTTNNNLTNYSKNITSKSILTTRSSFETQSTSKSSITTSKDTTTRSTSTESTFEIEEGSSEESYVQETGENYEEETGDSNEETEDSIEETDDSNEVTYDEEPVQKTSKSSINPEDDDFAAYGDDTTVFNYINVNNKGLTDLEKALQNESRIETDSESSEEEQYSSEYDYSGDEETEQ